MPRSSFSAAPDLLHPFISYQPYGLFVLAKPSDQSNRAAQLSAARLKRRQRGKATAMPPSLWKPWIVDWLHRPCDDGGKDENTNVKHAETFLFDETQNRQEMVPIGPREF
jgi:hypothetical protein